ncbi:hypothetical protein BBJ28_00021724 [Nothophytophthora sp. Chile5]|nr:hypothetical protein BBJ28_00021724 [Nothophytophthora sp. Chile5]
MRKATGTEMWRTLVELFEAPTNQTLLVHKQRQLVSELWHTRAKKDDDMLLHLGKLYDIRDRLTTLQYAVHDVDMVDAMLNSLPRHWKYQHLNQMVTLNPGANYTVDTVRDLILVAASQLKDESGDLNGGRTHSGNRGEAKNGKAGNQKGDKKEDQSKRPTESRKCFLCNKKGQIKKNCPDKETTSETTSADAMANSAEVPKDTKKKKEANGALLAKTAGCVQSVQVPAMMTPDVSLNGSSDGETGNHGAENADYNPSRWIYDTGASTHVVGSMNYFVAFQSFDENVEDVHGFARGVQPGARGIGSIALTTDVGDGLLRTFFLEDVMFVPEANWNLFSVGLARKQGFVEEKNEATEDTEAEDSEASDSKAEDSDTADSDAVMESVGSSADEMGTDDEFASIAESVTPVRPRVFLRAPLANDPSQHEENAEPDKADSDSDPEGDEEDCVSAGEIADPGSESEVESAINRTGDSNSEESASVQSDAGEENDDEVRSVEETGQPEEQTADSDHSSELADPPPQDMDIETYGFDEEKEEELDRERALVDAMRSLNEVTLHHQAAKARL